MRVRRALAAAAIAALAFPTFPPSIAPATELPGPCPLEPRAGETVQHFARRLIRCAVERWPVPGGAERAICIARRESGLDPSAISPTGDYRGLFQHARESWPTRYETFTREAWELPEPARNGRTNAIVTVRMVRRYGGWGPAGWPAKDCR
ncbi:MAG: hypothetical protein KatS3mg013_0949 [Actinomycetota bacterium]|jgi:hypothetical protein|nr:MAG: hypothetical protein KatS3mg013_0949 [Actinomycetota bacterium]